MDRRRGKFLLALALYAGWLAGLGSLAYLSGSRPQPRLPTASAR